MTTYREFKRRLIAIWYIIQGNAVIFNTRMELSKNSLCINGKDFRNLFIENNQFYKETNDNKIYFGKVEVNEVIS